MTNKEIYKVWAPTGKKWVEWVRPVPFVAISRDAKVRTFKTMPLPVLADWQYKDTSAIIVDLPGADSVAAGLWLAQQYGYRPVPIYNGVMEQKGAKATSDNRSVLDALVWGTSILSTIELSDRARPVFLTDTNRLQRHKVDVSIYDNSWDVYHQDLPTEDYFLRQDINKILVISSSLSRDLKKIFAAYPKKQISIYWSDGFCEPKCIKKGR